MAGVLGRFGVSNIAFREIETEEAAFRVAHSLRAHHPVIDLQQLNSWFDWPQQRHLFDDPIHERATRAWDDPVSVARWGKARFADIFREMLGFPDEQLPRRRLRVEQASDRPLLLFPHACTDIQQLGHWRAIAEFATGRVRTTVVGLPAVRDLARWPSDVELLVALPGEQLVDLIAGANLCIGGATGLTHLAAELERPTLFLWRHDDRDVFAPVRGNTAAHLDVAGFNEERIIAAVSGLMSEIWQPYFKSAGLHS
ncbi:glycosyltransferase family 9 protein [Trinickia terrae]|uniref:glycosyltransferase family 9 protein n=1 Tax=Trinickia terrae TaxID=2571161 RepID=UPI00198173C0|nr:glycosyltransferase family 9 protein [Trinickia terrae]